MAELYESTLKVQQEKQAKLQQNNNGDKNELNEEQMAQKFREVQESFA
jgi:hypothetical protein